MNSYCSWQTTNDYADAAAERLLRKCSTSWVAYQYLQDRLHDAWLPESARQQVRQIIKRIQVQLHQQREYWLGVANGMFRHATRANNNVIFSD